MRWSFSIFRRAGKAFAWRHFASTDGGIGGGGGLGRTPS